MAHAPIAGQSGVARGTLQRPDERDRRRRPAVANAWPRTTSTSICPAKSTTSACRLADDVLQVVTGTNIFQPTRQTGVTNIGFNLNSPQTSEQNYMVVEVYEDRIDLTIKQIETKIWGNRGDSFDPVNDDPYKNREARVAIGTANAGFQVVGTLTIDKSGGSPVYRIAPGCSSPIGPSAHRYIDIDLNRDGNVDAADAHQFLVGMHSNMTGLTPEQAFAKGDLNGDFKNNYFDFRIFKTNYDIQVGAGAV